MSNNTRVSKINLLPHNKELYNKIVEKINKGERSIFYSQATGLGKSFIFMKLVEEYFQGKKIMYVVPKIAIWDNMEHYKEYQKLNADIDMKTFAFFNKYEPNIVDKYDVVFVDECHHLFSSIQGNNVTQLMNDMLTNGKYVFGLTATPYVKGKFVDEEYFNTSCYGLDIYDAIEAELLPKIDLGIALTDDVDIPNNLRETFSISGTKSMLEQLIADYAHVSHWLAYFSRRIRNE